jgi:Zn-dependent peptidase ImmA (M78 family)
MISSGNLPEKVNGLYDLSLNSIVIERNVNYTQKRCALVHELIHWHYGDDRRDSLLYRRAECRTRRMTASVLVSSSKYATLENLYEGNVFLIANDLNVTKNVITDFQTLVLRGECLGVD